jgi:hypothetical protein
VGRPPGAAAGGPVGALWRPARSGADAPGACACGRPRWGGAVGRRLLCLRALPVALPVANSPVYAPTRPLAHSPTRPLAHSPTRPLAHLLHPLHPLHPPHRPAGQDPARAAAVRPRSSQPFVRGLFHTPQHRGGRGGRVNGPLPDVNLVRAARAACAVDLGPVMLLASRYLCSQVFMLNRCALLDCCGTLHVHGGLAQLRRSAVRAPGVGPAAALHGTCLALRWPLQPSPPTHPPQTLSPHPPPTSRPPAHCTCRRPRLWQRLQSCPLRRSVLSSDAAAAAGAAGVWSAAAAAVAAAAHLVWGCGWRRRPQMRHPL